MIFLQDQQFLYEIKIFQKLHRFLGKIVYASGDHVFCQEKCNNQIFYWGWPNGGKRMVKNLWQVATWQVATCQVATSQDSTSC